MPVALVAASALLLAACGSARSGTTGAVYGPRWGRFSVAFPSKPQVGVVQPMIDRLPRGSAVAGYVVGGAKDVFLATPVTPLPPSYVVMLMKLPSTAFAAGMLATDRRLLGRKAKPAHLTGAIGVEVIGSEHIIGALTGGKPTDPSAVCGVLLARKGGTVFWVIALTRTKSAARAFLSSFNTA